MSRTPASYPMVWTRGSTVEEEFTYTDDDGLPIDLTGYEARMQVRTAAGQYGTTTTTTLVMELTTDNYLRWDTAATGRLVLTIPPADQTDLNPLNAKRVKYVYAIEVYLPAGADPEYVIPLVGGTITVKGEITR